MQLKIFSLQIVKIDVFVKWILNIRSAVQPCAGASEKLSVYRRICGRFFFFGLTPGQHGRNGQYLLLAKMARVVSTSLVR